MNKAILISIMLFLLFFGTINDYVLLGIILFAFSAFLYFGYLSKNNRGGLKKIDYIANNSPLSTVNTLIKIGTVLVSIVAILGFRNHYLSATIMIFSVLVLVFFGKVGINKYLQIFFTPLAFIFMSVLPILFDYGVVKTGNVSLPFFSGYLNISQHNQVYAFDLILHALSSVSCLYFLSFTTPIHKIIDSINKIPGLSIFSDLMFLVYRFFHIINDNMENMKISAQIRFGFKGLKNLIRSTGYIMTNIFILSFKKAGVTYDSMIVRGYGSSAEREDGTIVSTNLNFFIVESPVRAVDLLFVGFYFLLTVGVMVVQYVW